MKRKAALLVVVAVLLVGGHLLGDALVFATVGRGDLGRLYAVATELRRGMPREEVVKILDRHTGPTRIDHASGQITLIASIGLVDTCSLSIWFYGDTLNGTYLIGEDSPQDACPGSPPRDIRP